MADFRIPYASRGSAYPSRISDLIRNQGEIAARRAERSGEIWSNSLLGIAQGLANIPRIQAETEERKARAERQKTESAINEQQLADLKTRQQRTEGFRSALGSGQGRDKILATLEADPEAYKMASEHFGRMDDARGRFLGTAAAGIRAFKDSPQAVSAVLDDLVEQGYDPQKIEGLRQKLSDPAAITPLVDSFLSQSPDPEHRKLVTPKQEAGFTLGEGQVRYDSSGKIIATGPSKESKPAATTTEEDYIFRKFGTNPTPAQMAQGRREWAQAGHVTAPKAPADPAAGDSIADAWREGKAFPSTQEATTAALESFKRRGLPVPRRLTAAMQAQSVANADTIQTIEDVRDLYERVKGKVGPVAYAFNEFKSKVPLINADPDFVEFNTMLRGMGNLDIKRITGAQMSEAEADRLLKGMATGSLKPAEFEAALRTMERNAKRNQDILLYGATMPRGKRSLSKDPDAGTPIP